MNQAAPAIRPPPQTGDKGLVVVIDGNIDHRRQVAAALSPFYRVACFAHLDPALPEIVRLTPRVALIDEAALPRGGADPIRILRNALPGLLVVSTLKRSGPISGLGVGEADACLEKPYRRSTLLRTISGLVNRSVEAGWADLPAQCRESLQRTVEAFNALSSQIESGEPLAYGTLRDACTPLVGAVRNQDFKLILENVRGHDNYSYVHSMRVATLLSLFGHTVGLSPDDLAVLASGGLVHDIGKMSIPHEVLNKPGRLDEKELAVMRSHVRLSVDYLSRREGLPRGVIVIAEQHHEKLCGTGYPRGLKGGELNELARMAAIVDIFSALTDRRVYKEPMAPEKALALMGEQMADEIDPRLLALFKDMLLSAVAPP